MADKFADLEEPKSRNVLGLLAVLLIVGIFLLFRWSGSAPRRVSGIVQSAGAIAVGRIGGGTQESATIRLADGTIVIAYVVSGGPLAPGDSVNLVEEHRPMGGPVYQVVGKEPRH